MRIHERVRRGGNSAPPISPLDQSSGSSACNAKDTEFKQ